MPSSSGGQFARLALCSHVFYEKEIIEQRHEIESLKLKLFWKDFDIFKLQEAIKRACRRHVWSSSEHSMLDWDWFYWASPIIQSCGLEVEVVDWQPGDHATLPPQVHLDTHFVCRKLYHITSYGTKLWKATSVEDPELKKLKALFYALNGSGP